MTSDTTKSTEQEMSATTDEQRLAQALPLPLGRRAFGKQLLLGLPVLGAALALREAETAEAGSSGDNWKMEGNGNVDDNDFIGTTNNKALVFKTNNNEAMRITAGSGSFVGIGTPNPLAKVHIATSNPVALRVQTSSGAANPVSIMGILSGSTGIGVQGSVAGGGSGPSYGVFGSANTLNGYGVYGINTSGIGVYGTSNDRHGVSGSTNSGNANHAGVYGANASGPGVYGTSSGYHGVNGYSASDNLDHAGVHGSGLTGVLGESSFVAVKAVGGSYGVTAEGNFRAISASIKNNNDQCAAIYGTNDDYPNAFAGWFDGKVKVVGQLSKSSGSFKIDHPLDPENKYLYHSFVESPDMMNIYNGTVTLDANGEAVVELPSYFEALNMSFQYQLTCIGGYAPVFIKQEIQGNRFAIAGGTPGLKVSWQVTGVRNDPFARNNRIAVEVQKDAEERGTYLHPEEHGQPREKSLRSRQMQLDKAQGRNQPDAPVMP
jgi:hypothetical protein